MVAKVAEADVKGTARRLANKVAERAEGGNFALVEELPEVEAAMVNLKQTDTAYRELLAVLREAFVAQGRAVSRQLRVANRAEVIGRDIEGEAVSLVLHCSPARKFCNHSAARYLTSELCGAGWWSVVCV